MKLYYHRTDGGAEYYCSRAIPGTDEGDLRFAVLRTDGNDIEPLYNSLQNENIRLTTFDDIGRLFGAVLDYGMRPATFRPVVRLYKHAVEAGDAGTTLALDAFLRSINYHSAIRFLQDGDYYGAIEWFEKA